MRGRYLAMRIGVACWRGHEAVPSVSLLRKQPGACGRFPRHDSPGADVASTSVGSGCLDVCSTCLGPGCAAATG